MQKLSEIYLITAFLDKLEITHLLYAGLCYTVRNKGQYVYSTLLQLFYKYGIKTRVLKIPSALIES